MKTSKTAILLAGNVRRILLNSEMSQGELALKLKITAPVVSRWLSAKHPPAGDTIDTLAEALGVEPHELLLPVRKGKVRK